MIYVAFNPIIKDEICLKFKKIFYIKRDKNY